MTFRTVFGSVILGTVCVFGAVSTTACSQSGNGARSGGAGKAATGGSGSGGAGGASAANGGLGGTSNAGSGGTTSAGLAGASNAGSGGANIGAGGGGSFRENLVRVFVLAGQSNMEGQGEIEKGAINTLTWVVNNDPDGKFAHLRSGNAWAVRDDVAIYYDRGPAIGQTTPKYGFLTAGYGSSDTTIGPELEFGHVIGDRFEEPILIIKTAWGGKSLNLDFTPPTKGGPGPYYEAMMDTVHRVLSDAGTYFPQYAGYDFEIDGFAWHQGWNDLYTGDDEVTGTPVYQGFMEALIKDVRKDFGIRGLPFVIASTGQGGGTGTPKNVAKAQLAMGDPAQYPEFAGNVIARDTRPFWFEADQSPADQGYHWNRNAHSYLLIGAGLAEDLVTLMTTPDCNGNVEQGAYLDDCGQCAGGGTAEEACHVDCNGDLDGTAALDGCGVCAGGATGVKVDAACINPGGTVTVRQWNNISGSSVSDIPIGTAPDVTYQDAELLRLLPGQEGFGLQVKAVLTAPVTGNYTFWLATDRAGEIYLSSDASEAKKQRIAYTEDWAYYQQYDRLPTQKSATQALVAGNKYYFELLYPQVSLPFYSVAWEIPGESRQPLSAVYLQNAP